MRPTREGRVTPDRTGLVYKGIGIDPDVPTTDPEPPSDLASGAQAYVPFASLGDVAIAQFKAAISPGGGSPVTVTLDASPTVGNVLVLMAGVTDDGGPVFTITNGTWTQVPPTVYSGNGTNWPNRMYYQVVTPSTIAATTITSSGGSTGSGRIRAGVIELSGVDSLDPDIASASNTATTSDSVTPSAGVPAIAVSAAFGRNVSVPSLAPAGGMTEWSEEPVGSSRPYALNYQVIATTAGAYTLGSTGAAANSSMIGAIFIDTGTSITWIEAPLTVDGDDATYDYAYDTGIEEFWRVDLGDTYLIGGMTARLAYETAGSNPIILQGANEADFSDAVTVASIPFTATGSFTAQDVTDSWTPTAVYRYWQLVQTTEDDVRVHDVTLLGFEQSAGVTDHDDLSGLTNDDHKQYTLVNEGGQDLVQAHGALGAAETIDPTLGNVHTGTLDANCTVTLSAPPGTRDGDPSAAFIELRLTEDGTGGWTPTFAASGGSIAWVGGTTPTHTTTLNTLTVYLFETVDGGTTWLGMMVGGGGSSLTIEDEGTPLTTAATTLDFVGAGVVASGATADKTITISGAPSGAAGGDLSGTYPNPSVVDDSHSHTGTTLPTDLVGPILITDTPAGSPLVFADLLQNEAGDDLLYADV